MDSKAYSKEETDFIIKTWPRLSIEEMAKELNRTVRSVACKRSLLLRLGLVCRSTKKTSREWSDKDLQILSDNYGLESIKSLAKRLKRSQPAISVKASRLGLTVTGQYYSLEILSRELGVSRDFIKRRISRGWLKASRSILPFRYGKYPYIIMEDSIIEYLNTYPDDLDIRSITSRFFSNIVREVKRSIV